MKRIGTYLFIITIFCISSSFVSHAGDINGNEQSVLSVAQGEFQYNGETYRAKSAYVNQLISYLQQDDVNLSSSDAQVAISQIYANVSVGVESGYLEKVGGSAPPSGESDGNSGGGSGNSGSSGGSSSGGDGSNTSDTSSQEQGTPASTQSQAAENPASGEGTPQNSNTNGENAGQGSQQEEGQGPSGDGVSEPGNPPDSANGDALEGTYPETGEPEAEPIVETPKEIKILEDIASSGSFSDISSVIGITSEPISEIVSESEDKAAGELSVRDEKAENSIFPAVYKHIIRYVLIASLCIAAISGILILSKRLYHYQYGSKKLRKAVRMVIGTVMAVNTFIMLFTAGLGLGYLRDTIFQKSIDETGYYEKVYENFLQVNRDAFGFLEIPDKVFTKAASSEQITMAAKQQLENDLHQGSYQVNVSAFANRVKSRVRDYISEQDLSMTQEARRGLDLICQYLENEYSTLLSWKYASLWGEWHGDFMIALGWILPMSMALLIVCHLMIISMHHFKHRGIRQCGFSIGAGAAGYLIFNIVTKFLTERKGATGETFLDEFLFHFLRQGIHISLLIGLAGICLALGYLALAKATKEGVK